MLTDEQYERLPPLLQEIVKLDRLYEETARLARHSQQAWSMLRIIRQRRAELRQAAERVWGYQLRGDNQGRTA